MRGLGRRFKTVVVAIDGGAPAEHALSWASRHLVRERDALRLLSVEGGAGSVSYETMVSVEQPEPVSSETLGSLLEPGFRGDVVRDVIPRHSSGSVGEAICEYMERLPQSNSDDITLVLGTRELGFLSRTLLGSVSEYCVRNCHCPGKLWDFQSFDQDSTRGQDALCL
jgi:nucleotide-binding universal stress UspA family protein